jgi:hypothetical protein
MNPVRQTNSKWEEIRQYGLLGRQLDLFKPQNAKWLALLGLVMLGMTFYWSITYSGPYRYLAEWELKWVGSYSEEVTALLVFVGLLFGLSLMVAAIKLVFRGAEKPLFEMHTSQMTSPATPPTAIRQPPAQVVEGWILSCRRAILFAIPFVVLGVGAYFYYNGTHEGSLQQLSAVDFESGKVKARVVFAEVQGRLSRRYVSDGNYRYIPMASEEKSTGPVRLLVGINEGEIRKYLHREANGAFTVRGVADKGIPGDLRYAFEKDGTAVADPVWVVHAGRDPSWDRLSGLLTAGFGVALGAFVFGFGAYQKRKRAAVRAVQATA